MEISALIQFVRSKLLIITMETEKYNEKLYHFGKIIVYTFKASERQLTIYSLFDIVMTQHRFCIHFS